MNIKKFLTAFCCCLMTISPLSANAAGKTCGKAYLIGEIGSQSNWSASDNSIKIDGDAKYEYTWNTSGDIEYLALCISPDGGYSNFNIITFPKLSVEINEVWVDDKKIDSYKMNPNAADLNYFSDGKGITRIYLKNGTTPADINDISEDDSIEKSVRVVFTVSGTGADGTSNFVPVEVPEETKPTSATKPASTTKATSAKKQTETTTSRTTTANPVSSSDISSIDKSAPTGDNGTGLSAAAIVLSGLTLMILKSGKKKDENF